eukprot:gene26776-35462_t
MFGGEFIKIADPKGVVNMRNSSSASHRLSESYDSRLKSRSEVDDDNRTGCCCCLCCCCGNKSKRPTIDASEPLLPNESSAAGTKSTQKNSSDFAPSVLEKFISKNENDKTREVKQFSWFGVFSSASAADQNDSEDEEREDQSIQASMSHHSSHRISVESSDGAIISSATRESSSSPSTSQGNPSSTHSAALQQVMENHNKKIHATFPALQPQGGYLASPTQDEPGGFSEVAN